MGLSIHKYIFKLTVKIELGYNETTLYYQDQNQFWHVYFWPWMPPRIQWTAKFLWAADVLDAAVD